jgi:hypothetical protein
MNLERIKYLAEQLLVETKSIAADPIPEPVITTVFPYWYNSHLFTSQAELDTYIAAVAERDRNLDNWQADQAKNFKGTISSAILTLYDWAFFFQKGLDKRVYEIFSAPPVYKDNATGRTFTPGDLIALQGVDVSAYASNGGVLAKFA